MQTVSEIMTRNVQFISPQDSIRRAAQMMDELNVGALPVCDGERLVGMVTDRDITIRATSDGIAPDEGVVDDVMSTDVRWCFEDQPLDEVMQQMADTQIRRVPVVSHDENHRLVGIVSLGDIAVKSQDGQNVEQVVEKVSYPAEPDLSAAGVNGNGRQGNDANSGVRTSNTGTSTGIVGSDILADRMNPGVEVSSTADPSEVVEVTPNDLVNKNAPGSTDLKRTSMSTDNNEVKVVRRAGKNEDTSSGETGAPGGIDAAGPSGPSGGVAGTSGSPGTPIGKKA